MGSPTGGPSYTDRCGARLTGAGQPNDKLAYEQGGVTPGWGRLMTSPFDNPVMARESALFLGLLTATGVVVLAAGGWLATWLGRLSSAARLGEGKPASGCLLGLATAAAAVSLAALALLVLYLFGMAISDHPGR
jgi:hypothetical protein